ncbi:hypothetical protein BKA58DRAFT_462045 [Alternaria rosae]|uniref:uncharacterized protein n=1 Tax=Alternaria rosae TaxID=1187941 RepID=UPI001E8DED92|nr:uncharacterized protein BKA58DRAFT_462045 [Alternaria rosae]KAH6865977.1 hypothetical protein BKA58DRAFT_462045 [Alternaria rosae]
MPSVTMAINSKVPTARKSPITSSPRPKVPTKAQQQCKTSVSQTVPQSQQQRKNSNAQSSPKVVQHQRKSPATKPPAMVDNKRKIKAEDVSPTMTDLQVKRVGVDKGPAQPETRNESPPKKQKIEMKADNTQEIAVTSPSGSTFSTPHLQYLPVSPPTPSQSAQMLNSLLRHVLHAQPTLVPSNPSIPITSTHIDNIAHTMWQIAFKHGVMLERACQYSAMYAPLKLAALAKLNFLPSWWFFRDLVVGGLPGLVGGVDGKEGEKGKGKGEGIVVDDREMQCVWDEAVKWCRNVVARRECVDKPVVIEEERGEIEAKMVDGDEGEEGEERAWYYASR